MKENVRESIEYPKRLCSYMNQRAKRRGNVPALWGGGSTASLVEEDYSKAQVCSNYFGNAYIVGMTPSVHKTP